MTLALDTSKWSQTLWRSHLSHSQGARQLVAAETKKQAQYGGFADDVHGALYLRQPPASLRGAPAWATDLLQQAQELAAWKPLKARCMTNGFAAGVGTETLLRGLLDLTPQGQEPSAPDPGRGSRSRRALRQALREAGKAVDAAEAMMEGVLHGGSSPMQDAAEGSLVALEQVRALHSLLTSNHVMQQMAQMAGRLEKLVAREKKSKAADRVGAITGLTLGNDLSRILPSELAALRGGRIARLQVLAKIQGRKALQYDVRGETPQTRGPVIVLLDKSSSLTSDQVAWEAAFGLTLLNICQAQKRTFALLNFDDSLHDEVVVPPGGGVSAEVCEALCHWPSGNTNFERPLVRALALLEQESRLGKADIFLVTDGKPNPGAEPTAETLAALQQRRETEGLSVFGLGIGRHARLDTIKAIASETYHLSSRPHESAGDIVPLLAQVA